MHEMTKQIIKSKSRVRFHNFKFLNTGGSPCSPATGACESTLTFISSLYKRKTDDLISMIGVFADNVVTLLNDKYCKVLQQ